MTLLSMMTALVFCSQIMSQKWPQVFLRGPCGQQKHTHTHKQTHFDQPHSGILVGQAGGISVWSFHPQLKNMHVQVGLN